MVIPFQIRLFKYSVNFSQINFEPISDFLALPAPSETIEINVFELFGLSTTTQELLSWQTTSLFL